MMRSVSLMQAMWGIAKTRGTLHRRERLFKEFLALGGIYIKFLQLLSLNSDFMKGWSGPADRAAFERAPYEPIELKSMIDARSFHSLSSEPFAAGSFAQVYYGVLHSGQPVIIKVLRPSVRQYLGADMRVLGLFVHILSWLWPTTAVDMRALFQEFRHTIRGEVNYRQEVQQALWFYDYFKKSDTIVVPKTYPELSNDEVIVQDYVEGVSLSSVIEQQVAGQDAEQFVLQKTGSHLWTQLGSLGAEFLTASLVADYTIGDPHPGNIKLLAGNKIGIIDFGLVAEAADNRQVVLGLVREYHKLYNGEFSAGTFATAMLAFFDDTLVSAMSRVVNQFGSPSDSFTELVARYVDELLEDHSTNRRFQAEITDRRMMRLFNSILNEGNRFGVQMNMRNVVLQKAMHTYIAMISEIGRAAGGQPHFGVMQTALASTLQYVEINGLANDTVPSMSDNEAYEIVVNWLERVSDRDTILGARMGAMI